MDVTDCAPLSPFDNVDRSRIIALGRAAEIVCELRTALPIMQAKMMAPPQAER